MLSGAVVSDGGAAGSDGAVVGPLSCDGVLCAGGAGSLDGVDGNVVVGAVTFTEVSDGRGLNAPKANKAIAIAAMTAMTMASAAMPEPLSVCLSIIVAMIVSPSLQPIMTTQCRGNRSAVRRRDRCSKWARASA